MATNFIKHPVTLAAGALTAVSGLFQIAAVDALFAFAWANVGQWFSIAVLMTTVGEALPIDPTFTQTLVAVLGIGYLAKQLVNAVGEAEDAIDDT